MFAERSVPCTSGDGFEFRIGKTDRGDHIFGAARDQELTFAIEEVVQTFEPVGNDWSAAGSSLEEAA